MTLTNLIKNEVINYELLEYLLKNGGSANGFGESSDDYGMPLFAAIEKNDLKAVEILLSNGADAGFSLNYEPPIIMATKKNNIALARLLLKNGATPNTGGFTDSCGGVSDESGYSGFPLNLAKDNATMSELLKEYGAKDLQSCIKSSS